MRTSLFVPARKLPSIESMELDRPTLQLIYNIVMITGVTSLALICQLLKRDKHKLNIERNLRSEKDRPPSASRCCESQRVEALNALPMMHPDIREYVTRRAQDWRARSQAAR